MLRKAVATLVVTLLSQCPVVASSATHASIEAQTGDIRSPSHVSMMTQSRAFGCRNILTNVVSVAGCDRAGVAPSRFGDLQEFRLQGQGTLPDFFKTADPSDRLDPGALSLGVHWHDQYRWQGTHAPALRGVTCPGAECAGQSKGQFSALIQMSNWV